LAWLGLAWLGGAKHSKARYFMIMARLGRAWHGLAGQNIARQGIYFMITAWPGKAGLGGAGHG